MRRRIRRQYVSPELDITAFMNLMVILVPFLLITAVFSRITVLDMALPTAGEGNQDTANKFQLEIIVRENKIIVQEAESQLSAVIKKKNGAFDYSLITQALVKIKETAPNENSATILAESEVEYDVLVQVMDHTRMYQSKEFQESTFLELFPGISIGDAPMGKK